MNDIIFKAQIMRYRCAAAAVVNDDDDDDHLSIKFLVCFDLYSVISRPLMPFHRNIFPLDKLIHAIIAHLFLSLFPSRLHN